MMVGFLDILNDESTGDDSTESGVEKGSSSKPSELSRDDKEVRKMV